MKENYNNWRSYGRSKLANVLFTYELARWVLAQLCAACALRLTAGKVS